MKPGTPECREPAGRLLPGGHISFVGSLLAGLMFYGACIHFAQVDVDRLWAGLPRLVHWSARAWPPSFDEIHILMVRAAETVAVATVGTTLGLVIAVPMCALASRNVTPVRALYYPARWVLNVLRGIDSFVFALLFVAAVGLGPFAGVLGVGLHSAGSVAKLWSEAIETIEPGPLEACAMTGANRIKIIAYALLPDILPGVCSISLYVWEFNVRASTVLGVVGAGGIGQELKNSVDLLLFPRVLTILLIILAMVMVIDHLSARLRRRLV
jgi:phosphonate transport system permease protein